MSAYFHSEREEVILSNNKGFILIEMLIGFSIIVSVITTIIPMSVLIEKERKVLSDRRFYASLLHDELQHYLWHHSTSSQLIDGITINFTQEGHFVRGCIVWENVKQTTDEICLYGLSKR